MKYRYRVQQRLDDRWRPVAGLAESEQVFDDADTAQNVRDELYQHPQWATAMLRTVAVGSGEMEAQNI